MKLILTQINPAKRIQSIKNVRAATGWGLKEAKYAVDALTPDDCFPGQTRPTGPLPSDEYTLTTGLTHAEALRALVILRADGHADGRIETEPSDADAIDAILVLAEVIRLARTTELTAAQIIAQVRQV